MYSELTFNVGKSDGDIQLQQTLNNLTLTISTSALQTIYRECKTCNRAYILNNVKLKISSFPCDFQALFRPKMHIAIVIYFLELITNNRL